MDVKKNIKQKGWTISAIAQELGVTQSALSQSLSNPTLKRMQAIAEIMGVSVSELVSEGEEHDLTIFACYKGEMVHTHSCEELMRFMEEVDGKGSE